MSHKGAVISGPRVNCIPFGSDAKGIEFPSGESMDLGVIVTTISHLCFVLFITFVTFAVATLLFVIVYSYTYTI